MRSSVRRAFTLLELLLVVLLIGVLAAFAWPSFSEAKRAEQLDESARRMQTLVAMCRAEALNEARAYRIRIRTDGSVRIEEQLDPLRAPHIYAKATAPWARTEVLMPDVWVAAVQLLPDGPPPIRIVDEELEFPEMEVQPLPVEEYEEFEQALYIDFDPDGSCNSLRWVLCDELGRARLLTLDGRLGRVDIEEYAAAELEDLARPEPLEEEEEPDYDVEDFR